MKLYPNTRCCHCGQTVTKEVIKDKLKCDLAIKFSHQPFLRGYQELLDEIDEQGYSVAELAREIYDYETT